jgi:outer membrane lipoprotein SlyB
MSNNEAKNSQSQPDKDHIDIQNNPLATGLGAAGGGVTGAAVGKSLGGKVGATVGGVAGAIAGGLAGNKLAELGEEVFEEINPTYSLGLGANNKPVELPRHYSWEELQALSKSQSSNNQ